MAWSIRTATPAEPAGSRLDRGGGETPPRNGRRARRDSRRVPAAQVRLVGAAGERELEGQLDILHPPAH